MSYRNDYRPPRDPHGYISFAWRFVIGFIAVALLAAGFLTGAIWHSLTH